MIKLYAKKTCPYSQKVMNFMEEKGIDYNFIDVTIEENREELINVGGKKMIPFIVDDENNVKMYESEEILKYLGDR